MLKGEELLIQDEKLKLARQIAQIGCYEEDEGVVEIILAAIEATEARVIAYIRDGRGPYVEGYGDEIAVAIQSGAHHKGAGNE